MASYKWKRDEVLKLIEMVEERNCLWNVLHADYHNQVKRRNCLAEIATALKIAAEEVKRKIHTLRAQYSKERSKMKAQKSRSVRNEIYQSKWEFFHVLQFMFRHSESTHAIDSMVIICCFAVLVQSTDEHRPKKKEKRQLDYSVSQHYPGPHNYRLERRISNGPQHSSHYSLPQYYPGPPHLYRKGRPHSLPPPPYAVQMEPLIHYSQRDPLYDTNTLSPDTDPGQDLADTNHVSDPIDRGESGDTIYIPHKPFIKVIEKPVFIKEPEPIIEIIIKESNVTLPPPPTEAPPPPQKKKKEEVQVFYVKYKKNPNGYGKDSVIYDKPVPAISPIIPDEPEPEEEWKEPPPSGYGTYSNEVTELPKPSTTLRTIIKPDSEVYHSPGNNVKVTFGKEGFDYDKRSSKPEDYPGPPAPQQEDQFPRARQLTSFSDVYFKRPSPNYYQPSSNEFRSEVRPPQPYRPFNNFPSSTNQHSSRLPNREYNSRPPVSFFPPSKYPYQNPPYTKPSNSHPPGHSIPSQSSRPSFPNFAHSISHPPPAQYQAQSKPSHQPSSLRYHPQPQFADVPSPSQRKPVPYTPFENLRPSQPTFSQLLPAHQHIQSFSQPQPTQPTIRQTAAVQLPDAGQNIQFRPETRLNAQQVPAGRPAPSFAEVNNHFKVIEQPQPIVIKNSQQPIDQNVQQPVHQNIQQHFTQLSQQQQQVQHQQLQSNSQTQYREHLNNLRTAQNVLPPGGELVHSLSKFEQHLIVDPTTGQLSQSLPLQYTPQQSFSVPSGQIQENVGRANKQVKNQSVQNSPQHYVQQSNSQDQLVTRQRASSNPIYPNQRSTQPSTARTYSPTTPKPTTTTKEPEKPSTTTKDPKILEAQLPDEVPDDLRQQLLSSGILNNADISILDYDKVGDIPLSALPPDQLANFYSAGGEQQLAAAGSEPQPQVAALTARKDFSLQDQEMLAEGSEISEVTAKSSQEGVELKVVKYNPETDKGQKVQEAYVSDGTAQVDPVVLNDNTYNRYLPLKVNGTQFPIPDVPELKGKLISSVVVLAPISYDFTSTRQTRETKSEDDIQFIQNEPLKELLANPTQENYQKFLENEKKTSAAKQAVILLVAGSNENPRSEKEIFMYDIATKTVSRLSGELSSAFVEAAEANSSDEINSDAKLAASNITKSRVSRDYQQPTKYEEHALSENPEAASN